jgi:hypothetical protein
VDISSLRKVGLAINGNCVTRFVDIGEVKRLYTEVVFGELLQLCVSFRRRATATGFLLKG